ncbi:glycosyltransferase family 2 protein [Limimaricola sp.]|uniref:glycosyltransferase family 2 protein n=1 Tax=Limimaricola sp. TaxID=2211665 RepID=UPI004058F6B4
MIVPVFNRAQAIARSVGSLCAQSYRNLEILVIDDGSSDDVTGAIRALGDGRVRLIRRGRNGGAAAARNTGIVAARGAFIAFQDSDDVSLFDRIECQWRRLRTLSPDHVGVHCAALTHTGAGEAGWPRAGAVLHPRHVAGRALSGDLAAATLRGNFIELPTMLLRREAVRAAGPFDARLRNNEDWDFTLRLARLGPFGFEPRPLYLFSYAPDRGAGGDHISRNPRYSTLSYVYITGKLRRSGHGGAALSRHYAAAGRCLMRGNRPRLARKYFRAALRHRPGQPAIWTHYLVSHVPALHRALRRARSVGR